MTESTEKKNSQSRLAEVTDARDEREPELSVRYILGQIAHIVRQTEYLDRAIDNISVIEQTISGDISGKAKATAIADVVRCRETTNQQILRLYEKMYDDLRARETETLTQSEKTE